jgi:hypothetical protein
MKITKKMLKSMILEALQEEVVEMPPSYLQAREVEEPVPRGGMENLERGELCFVAVAVTVKKVGDGENTQWGEPEMHLVPEAFVQGPDEMRREAKDRASSALVELIDSLKGDENTVYLGKVFEFNSLARSL